MTKQVSLLVNDQPIELDYFVLGLIDHTIGGMLTALEGTGNIENADISINGEEVTIGLNNGSVPANLFVQKIFKSTILGMVSTLKGVDEIDTVKIHIER